MLVRGKETFQFSPLPFERWRAAVPFILLIALAFLSWGCRRTEERPLPPGRVHSITREMMHASAAFGKPPGDIAARLQFDGTHAGRMDHLYVVLPAAGSEQSRRALLARLIQSLDGIATANRLTCDPPTNSGVLLLLNFRKGDVITNSVHVIAPLPVRASAPASPRFSEQNTSARLAIILDDLGSDRAAADAIFTLPYPLTISVLPNHAHSADIAEEAHRRGFEVLLHLPMQSVGNEMPEAQELRPGMPADELPLLFEQMMESVPFAAGVNNHQGSQATADPELMEALMPVLLKWNLFYVDSRTTAATVAYDTAQRLGVRSGFRNVPFLDDVADVSAVRKQLELALRGAKQKGAAIAIGHPHPATLQALHEVLPQAKGLGVQLVFVSDVVQ